MKPTTPSLSPFRWKEDPRPSIFATDPHFRSRYKAGLIDNGEGLQYKQFGTRHTSKVPLGNIHSENIQHDKPKKITR
jgi:hypothetical protein